MKGLTAVGSEIHHVTVHLHVGVLLSDASCPPWTVGHQAPLSVGFSRQEYWSRVAVSFSRGSSPTQGPNPRLLHCRRILDHCASGGALTVHFLSTRYLPGPRQGAAPTAVYRQGVWMEVCYTRVQVVAMFFWPLYILPFFLFLPLWLDAFIIHEPLQLLQSLR